MEQFHFQIEHNINEILADFHKDGDQDIYLPLHISISRESSTKPEMVFFIKKNYN